MPANNRSDIAIETAEQLLTLIDERSKEYVDEDDILGFKNTINIIQTFIAALRISQGPRVGRPRKTKAES